MKQHIGVDIIEINRIEKAVERWGERFLYRIFTKKELELYRHNLESIAVRFAGKEAAMKALNNRGFNISWKDIEILSDINGKPIVSLSGEAKIHAQKLGLVGLEISLSHSRENAVAFVIGVTD